MAKTSKKIEVVDYQPQWAEQFAAFRVVFGQRLADCILAVEHVGSTSVPGLAAKPILDIDIVVADDVQLKEAIRRLEELGYRHVGDLGVPGREVVKPISDQVPLDGSGRHWPKHHLYVCIQGIPSLQNHLNLRDYLRQHPDQAQEYGTLKKRLAAQFPHDIDAYIDGKTEFILEALQRTGFSNEDLGKARAVNKQDLKSVRIIVLTGKDQPFLEEMFYTSLFVPAGEPPFPRSIIYRPDLLKYHQHWGRESDLGLLLTATEGSVGAAWSRFFTEEQGGYGFVDPSTPEIGIAIRPKFRGKGLGTNLLEKLLQELHWRGVKQVSLSVDERNRAMRLYRRLGFEVYRKEGKSVVMLKAL